MSYAADRGAQILCAAMYVDRILKGAKPADLPVEQPTRFELAIPQTLRQRRGISATVNHGLLV